MKRRKQQSREQLLAVREELLDVQDRLAILLVGLVRALGGHYATPAAALASAFTDPDASGRLQVKRTALGAVDEEWLQEQAFQGAAEAQAVTRHVLAEIEKGLADA